MSRMQTRFIKKAAECGICFTAIHIRGKLDCCNHSFCLECIQRWSETENSCPTCKSRFKTITRIAQRVEYRRGRTENVIYVNHKSQKVSIPVQRILTIITLAERMVQEEVELLLHRLHGVSSRDINWSRVRRILARFSLR